jgi:hypothetical protein
MPALNFRPPVVHAADELFEWTPEFDRERVHGRIERTVGVRQRPTDSDRKLQRKREIDDVVEFVQLVEREW